MHVLQTKVSERESDLTAATEELSVTQDPMVHMKDQLQKLIIEHDEMVHSGKRIEDVSQHKE